MMDNLRPIESRILEMRRQGLSDEEIAQRVRKSPETVRRIAEWATHPARGQGVRRRDERGLSPRQARILALRAPVHDRPHLRDAGNSSVDRTLPG